MTSWSELAKQCHDGSAAVGILSRQVRPSLSEAWHACMCIGLVEYGHLVTTLPSIHILGHSTGDPCLAGHHPTCLLQCADRRAAAAPSLLPQRAGLEARHGVAWPQGTCMHVCYAMLASVLGQRHPAGLGAGSYEASWRPLRQPSAACHCCHRLSPAAANVAPAASSFASMATLPLSVPLTAYPAASLLAAAWAAAAVPQHSHPLAAASSAGHLGV